MLGIPSLSPQEVADLDVLLVSAYENTDRFHAFRKDRLEESISYPEFLKRLSRIKKKRDIVFYCA